MTGLDPKIQTLELVTRTCPLGLRFADAATGAFVNEGINAAAWPPGQPDRRVDAVPTPGGVQSFHGLPGLRAFENSAASDPWTAARPPRDFQVKAADAARRFLPCTFVVQAPAKGQASLPDNLSPPLVENGAIPLFSAPWRVPPAGWAIVRAELFGLATNQPAAWAFVEVSWVSAGSTRVAYGLADQWGRLGIFFPCPEGPPRKPGSSPPTGATDPQWALSLGFSCAFLDGADTVADYTLCLHQSPVLARRAASPLAAVLDVTLGPERELNLGRIDLAPV